MLRFIGSSVEWVIRNRQGKSRMRQYGVYTICGWGNDEIIQECAVIGRGQAVHCRPGRPAHPEERRQSPCPERGQCGKALPALDCCERRFPVWKELPDRLQS